MTEELEKAKVSIQRMQDFDPEDLPRVGDLGKDLNFSDAVPEARRLVNLYRQLSLSVLDDLPTVRRYIRHGARFRENVGTYLRLGP